MSSPDSGPMAVKQTSDNETAGPLSVGRRVILRPITPADYDFVYELESQPALAYRWRHQGVSRRPEEVIDSLWSGTLAQFIVARRETLEPVGFVNAHNADLANGFTYIGMIGRPEYERTALMIDGVILFLNYLFVVWNFRMVYAESLEFNMRHFGSVVGTLAVIEGHLKEHRYFDGRYWDKFILAIRRSAWEDHGPRLLRAVAAPGAVVEPAT